MTFFVIKALHIVGIVSWFAGLLYIVRLFIYHQEALQTREEPEKTSFHSQFHLMEKRLWYGITIPAMAISLLFGGWMVALNPGLLSQSWMVLKLVLVVFLLVYHHTCGKLFKRLSRRELQWTSNRLRVFNEMGTLLLVAIVFSVVLKRPWTVLYATAIIALLGAFIFWMVKRARASETLK